MSILCLLLTVACIWDYRKRRIPNVLMVVMFVFGVLYVGVGGGLKELLLFPAECLAIMLLLYPLYKIGALGAGDVKLFGVCGAYLPREKFWCFLFVSLLIAAILSLIKMLIQCSAVERITYFCEYIAEIVRKGRLQLYIADEKEKRKNSICLAGPILGSVLMYIGGIY